MRLCIDYLRTRCAKVGVFIALTVILAGIVGASIHDLETGAKIIGVPAVFMLFLAVGMMLNEDQRAAWEKCCIKGLQGYFTVSALPVLIVMALGMHEAGLIG